MSKVVVRLKAIPQVNEIDIYLSEEDLTVEEWNTLTNEEKEVIVDKHVQAEDETNSPYLQMQSYHLVEE